MDPSTPDLSGTVAKHTPGPWFVHCEQWIKASRGAHEGAILVAPTYWIGNFPGEAAANARLIAAAPDLLEALQFLLDSEVNGWDIVPGQDKARAAIAKATGASL